MLLQLADLTISLPDGRLERAGVELDRLTELEAGLMAYLAARPGQDVSREELHREVWGYAPTVRSRAADFTMSRLRRKVEPDPGEPRFLRTVRGAGYRFEPESDGHLAAPVAPPPDAFVGRDAELARLHALWADGARLITILGLGGVGKTRLALEFVGDSAGKDGEIVAVDASGIRDRAALLEAVGTRLGLAAGAGDPVSRIGERLQAGQTLLLLDDVDQLVDVAAELVRTWLGQPAPRVLVTSRARLRIAGEHVLELRPLDTDHAAALLEARCEAVAGTLDPLERAALPRLAEQLAGWPLALELAAARTRIVPPRALLERLDPLKLGSRDRDRPERHQTVVAVLRSTFDALDPDEREALAAVSLLPHGTSLDALEALLPDRDPVDAVSPLADRALVRVDERFGEVRITTLGLVARFVRERVPDPQLAQLRARTLDWAATHAERIADHIRQGRAWRASLDAERANVHAVWQDRGPASVDGARLGAALLRWWIVRGSWEGLRDFAAAVLAEARVVGDEAVLAEAQLVHVNASRLTGHAEEAIPMGVAIQAAAPSEPLRREAAFLVGAAHRRLGDLASAEAVLAPLSEGRDLAAARAATVLALVYDVTERPDAAIAAAERALRLVESLDAGAYLSNTAINLAVVLRHAGHFERARQVLARGAETLEAAGSPRLEASLLHERGQVEVDAGNLAEAERHGLAELETLRRHGDRAGSAWPLGNLGVLAAEQGRLELARERLTLALSEHERAGHRAGVIATRANQAILALLDGDASRARTLLAAARAEAEATGFRRFHDVMDAFIEVAEGRWTDRPIAGPPQDLRLLRRAAQRMLTEPRGSE